MCVDIAFNNIINNVIETIENLIYSDYIFVGFNETQDILQIKQTH